MYKNEFYFTTMHSKYDPWLKQRHQGSAKLFANYSGPARLLLKLKPTIWGNVAMPERQKIAVSAFGDEPDSFTEGVLSDPLAGRLPNLMALFAGVQHI